MKTITALVLLFVSLASPGLQAQQALTDQDSSKIAAEVRKRGIGKTVRVTTRSGSEIKGKITEVKESSFIVVDKKKIPTEFAYSDVARVRGGGLGTGAKIGIVAAIAAAAIVGGILGSIAASGE